MLFQLDKMQMFQLLTSYLAALINSIVKSISTEQTSKYFSIGFESDKYDESTWSNMLHKV